MGAAKKEKKNSAKSKKAMNKSQATMFNESEK